MSLVAEPCLLRLGAIPKEAIEKVLGRPLAEATSKDQLSSPGTRYRHYAPKAHLKLFTDQNEMDLYLKSCKGKILDGITQMNLYAQLRFADQEAQEEIVIFCTPEMLHDASLMDRLQKAAQF